MENTQIESGPFCLCVRAALTTRLNAGEHLLPCQSGVAAFGDSVTLSFLGLRGVGTRQVRAERRRGIRRAGPLLLLSDIPFHLRGWTCCCGCNVHWAKKLQRFANTRETCVLHSCRGRINLWPHRLNVIQVLEMHVTRLSRERGHGKHLERGGSLK